MKCKYILESTNFDFKTQTLLVVIYNRKKENYIKAEFSLKGEKIHSCQMWTSVLVE